MYESDVFAMDEFAAKVALIDAARVGDLVSFGADGLEASLIPMLWEDDGSPHGRLIGHLTRRNPQGRNTDSGATVLALFRGVDGYVTPSWYPSKAEHGKVVPTWNYTVVQAHGEIYFTDDRAAKERIVRALTDRHEVGRQDPWAVDDAPPDFVDAMLDGIIGFELRITGLAGKAKMSQNRPAADAAAVIAGFEAGTPADREVAARMQALHVDTPKA